MWIAAALLALKHLLSAATESSERDVVQAQHDSSSSGDADAQAVSVQEPVKASCFLHPAKLPELPAEVRQKMVRLLGQDAERTLAAPLHGRETGGGR